MPRHNNSSKLVATINLDICDDPGEADTTTPEKLNKAFVFFQQARQKSLVTVIALEVCTMIEGSFSLLPNSSLKGEAGRATSTIGIPPTITLKRANIN